MDEQVWELRERGLSLRQVAAELSMSVGSVRRAIKRQPIELDILAVMRAARCASQPDYHELCSCQACPHGYARKRRVIELPHRRQPWLQEWLNDCDAADGDLD